MRKVLELTGEPFLHGGQEAFITNVLQAMEYTDMQIDVCTPYIFDNALSKKIIEDKHGQIFALNLPFTTGKLRGNILSPVYKLIRANKYDVVHIHSGSIMSLALLSLAAKAAGTKKIIVHSHAAGEKKSLKHTISKLAFSPILSICPTGYFACSKEAGEWKFTKKIIENQLTVITNGINLDRFKIDEDVRKSYREKLGYTPNDKVIGHAGRFSPEKNHRFIIDLFSELAEENRNLRLLLIGDGELRKEIEEYARQKKMLEKITFTGNVDNVQDYMQAMDLFILPSKHEGLGLVAIEAQACGLPVILSSAVPNETKVAEKICFASLDSIDDWKHEIHKLITCKKVENKAKLVNAGYDIKQTGSMLEKTYLMNR